MKTHQIALLAVSCSLVCGAARSDDLVLEPERIEVLISAKATSPTRFAASELTNFLSRVFGRAVPVVKTPTAGRTQIVVGTNEWSVAEGLDPATLEKPDSFFIKATPERLYLCGEDGTCRWFEEVVANGRGQGLLTGPRASLFAVYEFLETYADCRFYFPGELGEIVPRAERIVIPDTDLVSTPANLVRKYYSSSADGVVPDGRGRSAPGSSTSRTRARRRGREDRTQEKPSR